MDLEFDGVRVERDARLVLDIPRLHVRGGRTTAVLGPNGAGKTTLLRVLAGLERPRRGRVLFGGAPSHVPVAYVFQEEVFLRQSVRANLELGLRLRGVDRAIRRERVQGAVDLLGIGHLLERRADHLSGGEERRVSIARALCLRAPLVLLDEPLAGLDERTYSRLIDELPQLLGAFDATTLVVTHNRREALRLAQDLVVLIDGRAAAAGDKREVATSPQTADVAEVLGYTVLEHQGRRIAVAPRALKAGPGNVTFTVTVDDVLDLVDRREVVGRIGGVRVHVPLPADATPPARGQDVVVHADRVHTLGR